MPSQYLRTTDIAYAVNIHPNTVRMYEQWELLPPIPRTPSGYRQFAEAHLDQVRLIRSVMHFTWLGGEIRRTAYKMITQAAHDDLGGALEIAYQVLVMIQSERMQANAAAALLERWARGTATDATGKPLSIGQVAKLLETTNDTVRNWERNGLITVPRNPKNGYRIYGASEIGRLRVIRMLRHARYSTAAILRMLTQLDQGKGGDLRTPLDLRAALDTPHPDEDIGYAADQWLSTLAQLEPRANDLIAQLEMRIDKQAQSQQTPKKSRLLIVTKTTSGRAVVIGQFVTTLETVLDRIVSTVSITAISLCSPIAALLQGVFLPVHHITLRTRTEAQVSTISQTLHDFPSLPTNTQPPSAIHLINGIEVHITVDKGATFPQTTLVCGPHQLNADALETCLAVEFANERSDRHKSILKYLQKHSVDIPLLHQALSALDIPQAQQEKILSTMQDNPY